MVFGHFYQFLWATKDANYNASWPSWRHPYFLQKPRLKILLCKTWAKWRGWHSIAFLPSRNDFALLAHLLLQWVKPPQQLSSPSLSCRLSMVISYSGKTFGNSFALHDRASIPKEEKLMYLRSSRQDCKEPDCWPHQIKWSLWWGDQVSTREIWLPTSNPPDTCLSYTHAYWT